MYLIQTLTKDPDPTSAPKVASWKSGGETVQVITQREKGESEEDWCEAHDKAVAAAKLLWPED